MTRVALATVILSALALNAAGQQTVHLTGRVIADDTGDPIPNARVATSPATPGAHVTLTDRDGRFSVAAASATATLTASKSGYGRGEIRITAADRSIELRLLRGAAISGRVVDERGDPIMGARVFVEKPSAVSSGLAGEAATYTDDRGEYRLGGLQPGTFNLAVVANSPPIQTVIGPSQQIVIASEPRKLYYPGVGARADAAVLRLQPADEKAGIDLTLPGGQSVGQAMMMSVLTPNRPAATDAAARKTGVIRGRVVATDGRPVPHAVVRSVSRPVAATGGAPSPFASVVSIADDDGRFEIGELAAGSFQIAASKTGYSMPGLASPLGPPRDVGPTVTLSDGETRERVEVTLARWGTVSGRVFDELGDPMQGAVVQLLQVRYQAGRRRLVAAGNASIPTDDLGRFRISPVPAGQYIVSAMVGGVASVDLPGYTRAFFPGTPIAGEAQFVSVGLSEDVSAIEFSLSRARTASISGTLLNAAGEPSTAGSVRLIPSQRSASVTSVPVGARLMRDGRFEFPNVTPGQYVILVDRGRRNSSTEGEFGMLPVAVDGLDVTDPVVRTSAGSSITGRVRFDSFLGAALPRPGQIEITTAVIDPEQSPAATATADIRPDWTFEIRGVNGPRRLRLERAPSQWMLKEFRVNGIDVTDRPLAFGSADQSLADVEAVLTDRVSTVSGLVADDRGRPAAGARVIVFSPDRDRWYPGSRFLRVAPTSDAGVALFAALPAGSYYAAAVAQLPADGDEAWQEPAFLESLVPRASSFSLGDGATQVLNLKLADR